MNRIIAILVLILPFTAIADLGRVEDTGPVRFSFGVIGHVHPMLDVYRNFLELQTDLDTDFILVLGDFLKGVDIEKEWNTLSAMHDEYSSVEIYFVPGNHDIRRNEPASLNFYRENIGQTNYTFVWKNVRFIGISSFDTGEQNGFSPGKTVSELIEDSSNLNSEAEYAILFMHHARWLSRRDHPSKNLNSYLDETSEYWDEEVVPVLKKYNIRYVFGGDSIGYSYHKRDGITYFLTRLPGWDFTLHHPTALKVNALEAEIKIELLPFRLSANDEKYEDKGIRDSSEQRWIDKVRNFFSVLR